MTTQTVNIDAYGYTGTFGAKLRNADTIATVVATADTVVASGTIASRFICTFGETTVIPAGTYLLEFIVNGTSYILYVTLTGVDGETALARSERSVSDATLAKQNDILDAIDGITGEQLAAITVESGTIGNFPSTLTIGDSYDTDTGWIKISITDESGDPITALGSLQFSEAEVSFTAFRPNDSARIYGECLFVSSGGETYVKLTLTSEETTKGLPEYTYEGRLKFVWDSGSSSSDGEDLRQKTYKTTPFKFIANP